MHYCTSLARSPVRKHFFVGTFKLTGLNNGVEGFHAVEYFSHRYFLLLVPTSWRRVILILILISEVTRIYRCRGGFLCYRGMIDGFLYRRRRHGL
jgi:hypothetical protein